MTKKRFRNSGRLVKVRRPLRRRLWVVDDFEPDGFGSYDARDAHPFEPDPIDPDERERERQRAERRRREVEQRDEERRNRRHDFEPDGFGAGDFEPDGFGLSGRNKPKKPPKRRRPRVRHPFEPDGFGDVFLARGFEDDGFEEPLDIADGLYLGGNHRFALELRVDFEGTGIVSGDLFLSSSPGRDYLASFRTAPGLEIGPDEPQPWEIIFEARSGETATGEMLLLEGMAEDTVTVVLMADAAIPGLAVIAEMEMSAKWASPSFRRLAVEFEFETGTTRPPSYDFNGSAVTIGSVMVAAGVELTQVGSTTQIATPIAPWGIEQLHSLMMDIASGPIDRPQWREQLLWLAKPSRRGLLGVMFDFADQMQRQGTAVFEQEIRDRVQDEPDRKVIQTAVHEIGHGLNLAHRFEREVGRADSTSIMNYDWRYKGGGRDAEFWQNFAFQFDEDELAFLRHGARNKVIPGGAPFHSAAYWADGNGGYMPYTPEVRSNELELMLEAPTGQDGRVFEFGQPVFLKVTLQNNTAQTLPFNKSLLDPKGSFLEILIRRVGAGHHGEAMHFQPLFERCLDVVPDPEDTLHPGGQVSENLNIHFGSSGFAFAEPGLYDVQVIGVFPINRQDGNPDNDADLIFPSNKVRILVAPPSSKEEERNAVDVLFREDTGKFFVLGGSTRLSEAESDLTELCERRLKNLKTVAPAPIAANILRCKGINAGRWTLKSSGGCEDGDPAEAVKHLDRLIDGGGLVAFDSKTQDSTTKLRNKHQENLGGKKQTQSYNR